MATVDVSSGDQSGMKAKVYIETTIPSYLVARPSRDLLIAAHQQITRDWWEFRGPNLTCTFPRQYWKNPRLEMRPGKEATAGTV